MTKLQSGVWEQESKKGNKYWSGIDKESGKRFTMFKNNKDWDRQPDYNIIVEDMDDDYNNDKNQDSQHEDEDYPF